MTSWFDESRLDDEVALATADSRLRYLAASGARVRLESTDTAQAVAQAVAMARETGQPRAVIAAGPDSRLLRAVLEPVCPVPFVAWPSPRLPGWVGSLDLVVMLAPDGGDPGAASAVAEAVRRGCQVVVAGPEKSIVAEHAAGRDTTLLATTTGDQLATAIVMLDYLAQRGLGPDASPEVVAEALDNVAIACSPLRDLAVNPAKALTISLADTSPLLWGGSVLAARAARRVAESLRRATGQSALAGDSEHLLPILEQTPARSVFDDPYADALSNPFDEPVAQRPSLVILDDGDSDPAMLAQRQQLIETAEGRGVRIEVMGSDVPNDVARYAALLLQGTYAATYLQVAYVSD